MEHLDQDEWASSIKEDSNAVIIDVRTPEEYKEGFIANSINIDIRESQKFMKEIESLNPEKAYYIYCRSGARSGQACSIMAQLGFTSYNLVGGIMEWEGPIEN